MTSHHSSPIYMLHARCSQVQSRSARREEQVGSAHRLVFLSVYLLVEKVNNMSWDPMFGLVGVPGHKWEAAFEDAIKRVCPETPLEDEVVSTVERPPSESLFENY